MASYLVTGGAGFIGSHIVRRLVRDGRSVRVLDNLSTGKKENLSEVAGAVRFIQGDILDGKILAEAVRGADYIFHIAALPSVERSVKDPRATHEVNITGTLNVLLAAKEAGVKRVVFASSSSVYGDKPVLPKTESMAPEPKSPYAVSKVAGEYYCHCFWKSYGLKTVPLRFFNVFGPGQDPNSQYAAVIPSFISSLVDGHVPEIFGDGEQTRDFTFVENVVEANMRACHEDLEEFGLPVNVCSGKRITLNELYRHISSMVGTGTKPKYSAPRPGDVRDSLGDITRQKELLKIKEIISLEKGLRQTVDWFRARLGK